MSRRPTLPLVLGLAMLLGTLCASVPAGSQTPKRSGILNSVLHRGPAGTPDPRVGDALERPADVAMLLEPRPLRSSRRSRARRPSSPSRRSGYCSDETDTLIDLQSQELDRGKRLKLVWEIQRRLHADVARPMLSRRKEYSAQWPYVKNLVLHNALYNYGRMQDVWLDT